MRIGASNRLVWDLPLEEGIETLAKIGYECVEIWVEPPHIIPSKFDLERRRRLRNLLRKLNLEATLHSCSWDLNIASLNPSIRKTSVRLVEESIDLAEDLEVELVVVHPGRMSSSKGSREETYSILVEALDELKERAQAKGTVLALENMENRQREIITTPVDLRQLLETLHSNRLVGLVDVAHANMVLDPSRFLTECLEILGHVHVSDNNGSAPVHLPLGRGSIDFKKIFRILAKQRYGGKVIVEGFNSGNSIGSAREDFEFASDLLRSLDQ